MISAQLARDWRLKLVAEFHDPLAQAE